MASDKRSEVPARMWDEDSPMPNVLTMTTGDRRDGERTYVAVDALLTDDALSVFAVAYEEAPTAPWDEGKSIADQDHSEFAYAMRAAIAHATQEATDAH